MRGGVNNAADRQVALSHKVWIFQQPILIHAAENIRRVIVVTWLYYGRRNDRVTDGEVRYPNKAGPSVIYYVSYVRSFYLSVVENLGRDGYCIRRVERVE